MDGTISASTEKVYEILLETYGNKNFVIFTPPLSKPKAINFLSSSSYEQKIGVLKTIFNTAEMTPKCTLVLSSHTQQSTFIENKRAESPG